MARINCKARQPGSLRRAHAPKARENRLLWLTLGASVFLAFGAIVLPSVFFHVLHSCVIQNVELASKSSIIIENSINEQPPVKDDAALLEVVANRSGLLRTSGLEIVKNFANDTEPLRHIRFQDVIRPPTDLSTPPMKTAYQQATVVTQAPWFPQRKHCTETCCAQAVAISLAQDETRLINAVDGQDVADLELHGHKPHPFHAFAAKELTHDVVPCLRPGVIIHADSYRGPITRFFEFYRPNMTVPYVFITSRTDGQSPIKFYSHKLDEDPLLLAWYGINPNYKTGANHSKFRMMPLGLAGAKIRQQPNMDLLAKVRNYANPFGGDKSKWTDSKALQTAADTTPVLYVNFAVHKHAKHRIDPFKMACEHRKMHPLDAVSCKKEHKTSPIQSYTAASKYLFGLSPPGNGKDCFRTYELLFTGLIPIVKAQPEYDELFKDLPIIQLKHWNYSQEQLLKIMRDYVASPAFVNNTFDEGWKRMFLKHWRHQVLHDAGRLNEIVTDDHGNEYYQAWQYTTYRKPYVEHAVPEGFSDQKPR